MNIYFYPNDALTSADKPINAEQVFQTSKGKVYTAINLLNSWKTALKKRKKEKKHFVIVDQFSGGEIH